MTDHDHCSGKFRQLFFQQFQGFHIQIVGRFIKHQNVRWLAEQLGKQQPRTFTTREHTDRRPGPLRCEQELLQITEHMLALAININEFPTLGKVIQGIPGQIQLPAKLIEIGHLQIGTQTHRPFSWFQVSEQKPNQSRFAGSVFPHKADLVTPEDSQVHIADHRRTIGIGEACIPGFNNQFAGTGCILHREACGTATDSPLPVFLAHGPEGAHPAHVAGSACLDTLANPGFFLLKPLVEQRVLTLFLFQRFFLQFKVAVIGGGKAHEPAPIQLNNPGGHAPDKRPVVADKQHGATELAQSLFQPGDGRHIEVVGGFIQQQDVRIRNQGFCQQHTALPAAGQRVQCLIGIDTVLTENGGYLLIQPPAIQGFQTLLDFHQAVQAGLIRMLGKLMEFRQQGSGFRKRTGNHFIGCAGILRWQVLRQHCKHCAVVQAHHPAIRHHFPSDNPEQGRLAFAIASQQARALSGVDYQRCLVEQRVHSKSQGD